MTGQRPPAMSGGLESHRPPRPQFAAHPALRGSALGKCLLVFALVGAFVGIDGCKAPDYATLAVHVVGPSLPPSTRLAVQICEQAIQGCDRWVYPDANGRLQVDKLNPSDYTVTVFLETANGLTLLITSNALVAGGQTANLELVIPAIPTQPAT